MTDQTLERNCRTNVRVRGNVLLDSIRTIALVCAGCWINQGPLTTPVEAVENHASRPHIESAQRVRRSVWEGRYRCAQGLTALRLSLARDGNDVVATFEFGPLDINPRVPHGAFRMTGTATRDQEGMSITLQPIEWIEQPPHYVMVGLDANTRSDGHTLRGQIDGPHCGEVELARIEP